MTDTGRYDYVIIGAGSAGCVLANRLSADPSNRVLVLEAGPPDRNLFIHVPAGVYHVYRDPKINWNYQTEAEPELYGRQVPMPRGRVVGGSSSINSMVYMRGHPLDYDRWADEHGLADWRYANCLPYFKAGECSDRGASDWRGGEGPLGVASAGFDNPLYDAFVEAGEAAGQGRSEDLNAYQPEGVAHLDATKRNGRRCSAAVAHLHPALSRPNLTLITGALAHRIVLSGDRATGLSYVKDGQTRRVEAEKELILSGGAVNSPHLLMLSGIGPADHLAAHGIDVRLDLPGVGRNLQDHATVILQYACTRPVTIDRMTNPIRQAAAGLRWLIDRKGVAASNIWEAGGLIRSSDSVPYPDLQYHFGPVGIETVGDRLKLNQAFAIHVDQLRPRSRGQVLLRSADPTAKALLHFNYLSDQDDLDKLVAGVRKARELVAQAPFDRFRGEELTPGPHVQTNEDIGAAIRAMTETDYHPCGTCRMGHGPDAVVDDQMRVHGVEGLRVVDASVMPQIISANLNAPTQMIAARAADLILGKPQLPAFEARFHFSDGVSV